MEEEEEDPEDSEEAFVEEPKSQDWAWENRKQKEKELISQIRIMKALEEDADEDMEKEIRERKKVIELLGQGKNFFEEVYKEAEIVATAYSNFGHKVNNVAVKLAEQREGADSPL